ncbi:opioid growth factor receptor-related protein [Microvirga massiliensis]|uniref:opioid growth factor receptor-related protein n=1 Tax=Microvirga massiliensis TaxID=1033741 RepID=UPI00062BA137|nr:opioid growth factor receptor-related protein [Microvirga massiliensis]
MASELVRYLAGRGTDARGRTAADVIALSDWELERSHDWVQWLFPLPTRSSAVPGSPILSDADIAAIKSDPVAIATLERAVDRMITFYERTDHWLQRYDHNHLRITRILQSVSLLLGHSSARAFLDCVMALHEAAGAPVNPTSLQYWRDALRAR